MNAIKNREAKSNLLSLYLKNNGVGKVHSKFSKGINVQINDFLIYISCFGRPLSAFGLNIAKRKLIKLQNLIRVDNLVVNKDNKLIFYGFSEIISINYKEIKVVDLRLPKVKCSIKEIPNTKIYNYLNNIKFEQLIGIELDEITHENIDLLLSSNKEDLNINSKLIKFFSGRGKGLTPSGDDILTGFTLALRTFDRFSNWIKVLNEVITKDITTLISFAYHKALYQGYVSENFMQLIKLMDEKDVNEVNEIIKKVQSFGHTSGNDTLYGFLLGLKFLINQ
ncbi:DUF2877 domain-containing protein [Wukongibacter sp. M2B1]|uniref:DUF2877 domain-containing protein n=1 Tax=Wukongibacter sp. M2B1 TaxID=3088895 RepID=UPI003D7A5026